FTETVLDKILMEVKADTFGKMIYPKAEVPWIEPLSEEEIDNVLNKVEEDLYDSDIYMDLQHGTSKYPEWSNFQLPATYRPYGLIEVGDSWEQSVLDYGGTHHSQRFLLFTKLPPQSLRFLMDFSYTDACMRNPSANMFLLAFISL